jgi:hypothetical protein
LRPTNPKTKKKTTTSFFRSFPHQGRQHPTHAFLFHYITLHTPTIMTGRGLGLGGAKRHANASKTATTAGDVESAGIKKQSKTTTGGANKKAPSATTMSARAGVETRSGKILRIIKDRFPAMRISKEAVVAMCALADLIQERAVQVVADERQQLIERKI